MRIYEIHLENYKGFRRKTFTFSERITVLIGDNGTGKSALLSGLGVGIGAFFLGLPASWSRTIRRQDVHLRTTKRGSKWVVSPQWPASITCVGEVAGEQISWKRTLIGEGRITDRVGARPMTEVAEQLHVQVTAGKDVALPLIANYDTRRLWPFASKGGWRPLKKDSRLTAYDNYAEPVVDLERLLYWFAKAEANAKRSAAGAQVVKAIKHCIKTCMVGWQDVYSITKVKKLRDRRKKRYIQRELVAVLTGGRALPFRLLSDGLRNMATMVMDIAVRAVKLNPHWGGHAPVLTSGIVLIDEVDLHLHPKWQRRVIGSLRRAFPKLQFIATTHSPFIIQSLQPGELIRLDAETTGNYAEESIEDIVEQVQGVRMPQRSVRAEQLSKTAERYFELLQAGTRADPASLRRAERDYRQASEPYTNHPDLHALLKLLASEGEVRREP